MPQFTVSLIASIPVSAQVVITADSEAQALQIAQQMHSKGQLGWTYNGLPIPSFTGAIASVWSNPGIVPPPGPKAITITLTVSATTVTFGTPVNASCTIHAGATGLVSFYNGATLLGSAVPNQQGVASLNNITLPIGVDTLVARFAGDTYFQPGTSNTVQVTVNPPATQTVLVATPNPQQYGSPVDLQAGVTAVSGTPSGLVIFYDFGIQIGAAVLNGGAANFVTSSLVVGTHSLTAVYQGSSSFASSTSPPVSEVVQKTASSTVVITNAPSVYHGQAITFTATVTGSGITPTGTVTFTATSGSTVIIGTATLDGAGQAQITTSSLAVGIYTVLASYNGDNLYAPSSGTCNQSIVPAPLLKPFVINSWNAQYINDGGSQTAFQTAQVSNSCSLFGYTVTVQNGMNTVSTSGDLSTFFVAGTQIVFASQPGLPYSVQSISASQITLATTYTGSNATTTAAYYQVVPTGTFQFTVDSINYGSAVTLSGSTPSANSNTVTGGTAPATDGFHSPGGSYSGDSNYASASVNGPFAIVNLGVYGAVPSMSLSSQLPGTFTVSPGSSAVTSIVDMTNYLGGNNFITFSPDSSATIYSVQNVSGTSIVISPNFAGAVGSSSATCTVYSAHTNPIYLNFSGDTYLPLTATVSCSLSPDGPVPAGNIQFYYYDNGSNPGPSVGWKTITGALVALPAGSLGSATVSFGLKAETTLYPFLSGGSGSSPYNFSYEFLASGSDYNNGPVPTGGPPPTNGDPDLPAWFSFAG